MTYPRSSRMPVGRSRPNGRRLYRLELLNSSSKYFTKIYRAWRISLANSIPTAVDAVVPDWEVRERRRHACTARVDVRAHARGCATYRGVEEKIGSVTDTWCDGLSRFLSYPRRKRSRAGWWGGEEEVRREEERVHLLNLPAVPRVAPAR